MKQGKIAISIIVPTYNRSKIVKRSIESIRSQLFKEWECIVVDDHSSDDTIEVVTTLIESDDRFSVMSNSRKKGAPGARNTGIIAAQGEYIVLFDSDNVMHPDFLEKMYRAIKHENVDICGCFSKVLDEQTGNRVGRFEWEGYGYLHTAILNGKSYFDNSSTMIKKEKLFEIGLLDENCPSYQEWDTHIRLSEICNYTTLREELVDYYKGGKDTISKSKERAVLGQMYILNKFRKKFIKESKYTYYRHNILIMSWINEVKDIEKQNQLITLFKKDKSFAFLVNLRVLYFVKQLKYKFKRSKV